MKNVLKKGGVPHVFLPLHIPPLSFQRLLYGAMAGSGRWILSFPAGVPCFVPKKEKLCEM